jgi:uncharacterized repeat protein (TIGR01451 family)
VVLFGVNEVLYVVDIAPVALPAGITWVEIFTNSAGNPDQFFWEVGNLDATNGIVNDAFSQAAPGGAWLTGNPVADNAFVLCPAGGPTLSLAEVADADQCSGTPGNVNGIWEPGETIDLDITLAAGSASAMTGISGTLTTGTPGVTILTGNSTWPDIAASGSAVSNSTFQIQLDESIACGTIVDLTLTVTANEGGPFVFPISDEIGQPLEPNVPVAIPDSPAPGVESDLVVADDVILTDVNVRVEITHTWVGDLFITLRAPDNTEVVLLDRPGVPTTGAGCADDNLNVTFDDASAFDPENHCTGSNPWFSGLANPVGSLATFNGMSSAGTWSVFVSDHAGADIGSIVDWELLTTPPISGVCNVCVGQDVDLAITKSSDAAGEVGPGDPVVFTLQVTNNGPGAATGVVATDTLPAQFDYVSDDCGAVFADPTLTWSIGSLAVSASVTCNVSTVVAADATPGAVVNTATVAGNETDPTQANNSGPTTVDVGTGQSILEIPTLDRVGLAILLLGLMSAAVLVLRKR